MGKRFWIILIAFAAILLGIFMFRSNKAAAPVTSAAPSSHLLGAGKKNVTFVEYGDYQCPACGAYYPIVKQVQQKYGDDITFQFRNFPLTQIHPNAMAGARAAEAAGLQNRYWEMHDLLYEQQSNWSSVSNVSKIFEDYATQLALNIDKFRSDYNSASVNNVINADIAAGQKLGANATPTFVLDGKKIDTNPRDEAGFSKLIDAEIAKKAVHVQPSSSQP
ncbi:MAG: Na+/H+ antiporter, NhaA family protein nonfunctional [Candidatus Saccharibacteria bacterium]|nr:Na+/H+ antiporter, NhaA family protein nonfunctional [Candidatus Saccharibacteria bacterium]